MSPATVGANQPICVTACPPFLKRKEAHTDRAIGARQLIAAFDGAVATGGRDIAVAVAQSAALDVVNAGIADRSRTAARQKDAEKQACKDRQAANAPPVSYAKPAHRRRTLAPLYQSQQILLGDTGLLNRSLQELQAAVAGTHMHLHPKRYCTIAPAVAQRHPSQHWNPQAP